ncbi:hypothetical protein CC1G_14883 [Coprinopsis cinerea okayama7|uniref:Velvet domain-containing protein n=1 Tax=Coprinopsis cinerea (strain Okayama-7 / 130 / ATCC MYA-4618 / FGSC 9003) TaxID=240176 RepID=D6RNJ6_COPC7|nr:hypothetical protein CC1G_14883 [Coprinopsis cinerea okayama7\|eukprot:XP_002910906.1 hypothetical protein CC1G_14883 [Coprinopsis cinerea okayama7\
MQDYKDSLSIGLAFLVQATPSWYRPETQKKKRRDVVSLLSQQPLLNKGDLQGRLAPGFWGKANAAPECPNGRSPIGSDRPYSSVSSPPGSDKSSSTPSSSTPSIFCSRTSSSDLPATASGDSRTSSSGHSSRCSVPPELSREDCVRSKLRVAALLADSQRMYRLEVVQQPKVASEFGTSNLKRLPITPPIIVRLDIQDSMGKPLTPDEELPFLVAHLSLYTEDGTQSLDQGSQLGPQNQETLLYGGLISVNGQGNVRVAETGTPLCHVRTAPFGVVARSEYVAAAGCAY